MTRNERIIANSWLACGVGIPELKKAFGTNVLDEIFSLSLDPEVAEQYPAEQLRQTITEKIFEEKRLQYS